MASNRWSLVSGVMASFVSLGLRISMHSSGAPWCQVSHDS